MFSMSLFPSSLAFAFVSLFPPGAPRFHSLTPFTVLVVCSHMSATCRLLSFPAGSLVSLLGSTSAIALDCFATNEWGSRCVLKRAGA